VASATLCPVRRRCRRRPGCPVAGSGARAKPGIRVAVSILPGRSDLRMVRRAGPALACTRLNGTVVILLFTRLVPGCIARVRLLSLSRSTQASIQSVSDQAGGEHESAGPRGIGRSHGSGDPTHETACAVQILFVAALAVGLISPMQAQTAYTITLYSEYTGAFTGAISVNGAIILCAVVTRNDAGEYLQGITSNSALVNPIGPISHSGSSVVTNSCGQAAVLESTQGTAAATIRARWQFSMVGVLAEATTEVGTVVGNCTNNASTPPRLFSNLGIPCRIRWASNSRFTSQAQTALNSWQATGVVGFAPDDGPQIFSSR